VTAADTGVAEGVERIVPLGSEMDIAAKVVSLLFCSLREVVWRGLKGGVGRELYRLLCNLEGSTGIM